MSLRFEQRGSDTDGLWYVWGSIATYNVTLNRMGVVMYTTAMRLNQGKKS